ncbi:ubiquinol-cytochrome C chaperone family protein [Sphingomonas sp.]|uniref:ubiquinol-cytochrome C chaperone family protein n=1 Tax=Sphingomonas sp. TaxID=28214 RepID=UPI0025F7D934|nr:ubiquinol-cytochrome C chaperone family protein [Sphingomonas sp.]
MSLIDRVLGRTPAADMLPLYTAIVAEARQPGWYRDGGVPDTLDGRFDMISLVLSLVLLRLEREDRRGRLPSARLTEQFVSDMDGQLRETGFGDLVVGKQVGFAMGALGGRLGAYRGGADDAALVRNLWRGETPAPHALAVVRGLVDALKERLERGTFEELMAGNLG